MLRGRFPYRRSAVAAAKVALSVVLVLMLTPGLNLSALADEPAATQEQPVQEDQAPPQDVTPPDPQPSDPGPTEEPPPPPEPPAPTQAPPSGPDDKTPGPPDDQDTQDPAGGQQPPAGEEPKLEEPEGETPPPPPPEEPLVDPLELVTIQAPAVDPPPTVQVVKAVNSAVASAETFHFNWQDAGIADGDIGDGGSLPATPATVTDGYSMTVTEELSAQQIADGWTISDITCTGETGAAATKSTTSIDNTTGRGVVTFNAQDGEDIVCTFTNDAPGTISIEKDVIGTGADPDEDFVFTGDIVDSISENDGATTPVSVAAGDYTVTETLTATQIADGWEISDITCDDSNPGGSSGSVSNPDRATGDADFDVDPGEAVLCTFENELLANSSGNNQGDIKILDANNTEQTGNDPHVPCSFKLKFTGFAPGQEIWYRITTQSPTSPNGNVIAGPTQVFVQGALDPNPGDFTTGLIDLNSIFPGIYTGSVGGDWHIKVSLDTASPFTFGKPEGDNKHKTFWVGPCTAPVPSAELTIVKELDNTGDPDNGDTFDFTVDSTTPASAQDLGIGDSSSAITVDTDAFDVVETLPSGDWDLTAIACFEDGDPNTEIGTENLGADKVTLDLADGDEVTCTFTNKYDAPSAELTITKALDNSGDADNGDTFDFTVDSTSPASAQNLGIGDSSNTLTVDTDAFDVVETLPSGDWDLTAIACFEDGDPNTEIGTENLGADKVTLDLSDGDEVTCTFTNKYDAPRTSAELTIVKELDQTGDPDNGDTFDFTVDSTTPASAQDLGIGDSSSAITVDTDAFDVVETLPSNDWTLTGIACFEDGDPNTEIGTETLGDEKVALDLADGDEVTCTFTNKLDEGGGGGGSSSSDDATIQIHEEVLGLESSALQLFYLAGDPAAELFHFTSDITDDLAHGQSSSVHHVNAGTFTVTQELTDQQVDDGWELVSISCDDESDPPGDASFGSGSTATFEVETDEDVECTFVNALALPAQASTIQVKKVVTGPDASTSEAFNFAGDIEAQLSHNESSAPVTVLEGTYTARELLSDAEIAAGWELDSIACESDLPGDTSSGNVSTSSATFDVQLGENIVCTFTNSFEEVELITPPATPDRVQGKVIRPEAAPRVLHALPFTGASIVLMLLLALLGMMSGATLLVVARLRTAAGRSPGRR